MPALSYLSQPTRPQEQIMPFDLNLMAKTLSVEQGKFEAEGQKIQSQLDQLGSLDVIRDVDRQYLNQKVNKVVSDINGLGGVNLADQNISSQIEGMGSSIYGDDNVINAIASTKQIRNLQSTYSKMKTDPKLMKSYSKANEDWDLNNPLNPNSAVHYLSSGEIGASYTGASTASPYHNYHEELSKAVDQVKATLTKVDRPDGTFQYLTQTNEEVTPQRIMQIASYSMSPEALEQMKKDGAYAFKGVPAQTMVAQAVDLNAQKYDDASRSYNDYKVKAYISTNPVEQQQFTELANSEKERMDAFKATHDKLLSEGVKKFEDNPLDFTTTVYKDQYFRGLANKYAYNKVTAVHTPNYGQIAEAKLGQAERFHNDMVELKAAELKAKIERDSKGKLKVSPSLTDSEGLPPLTSLDNNLQTDTEALAKSEDFFTKRNAQLLTEKEDIWKNVLLNKISGDPALADLIESQNTGTGRTLKFKGQELFEAVNGKPGLQLDDFKNFDPNSPIAKKFIQANRIPQKAVDFISHIYENFENMSQNKAGTVDIDDDYADAIMKYQEKSIEQAANKSKVEGINKTIYAQAGLTQQEINLYEAYKANPSAFSNKVQKTNYGSVAVGSSGYREVPKKEIKAIQDKLDAIKADEIKKAYYAAPSNRPNYHSVIVPDTNPYVANGSMQSLIAAHLNNIGYKGGDVTIDPGTAVPTKNIQVQSVGKGLDGQGFQITATINLGTPDKPELKTVHLPIEADNAAKLGFQTDPHQSLNDAVNLAGVSQPLFIQATTRQNPKIPAGKRTVAKIQIVRKDLLDRNNNTSYVQVLVDGYPPIKLKDSDGNVIYGATPSEAFAQAQTILNTYGSSYKEFFTTIAGSEYKTRK